MASSLQAQALAAYRSLWRATGIAFKGDPRVMLAARHQARQTFEASMSGQEDTISEKIQHAEEVATMLRKNVVQGVQVDQQQDRFILNIHKDIERGDNETINTNKGTNLGGVKPSKLGSP